MGSGASVLVTARSAGAAGAFTVVLALALLFAVLLSPELVVAVAVFVMVPEALGTTWMVTVSLPPLAMEPRLQVTMPLACVQLSPAGGVADTKVTPAGSTSVSVVAAAAFGPALLTTTV